MPLSSIYHSFSDWTWNEVRSLCFIAWLKVGCSSSGGGSCQTPILQLKDTMDHIQSSLIMPLPQIKVFIFRNAPLHFLWCQLSCISWTARRWLRKKRGLTRKWKQNWLWNFLAIFDYIHILALLLLLVVHNIFDSNRFPPTYILHYEEKSPTKSMFKTRINKVSSMEFVYIHNREKQSQGD